ncbi:putative E3 ubiquitin-protein ligase UBR7 [Penaeus chinensis]|uniref:putative E3 ubiquitin-protein ligase UBR7 n=1 Tax=Penaeus chinensis TaxID=139456 RepID=UPI001FB8075F|nr:putative E3 ubiquitin-protein ligase UBR7 [Penaeus chinensis]
MAEGEGSGTVTPAEEEEESGISMVEVLEEEQERELDAAAVLGASDDTSCTYDQGNMKRQALYACMTCCPADSELLAGVCLACSYHCHEDHELVELYTKRHFRCDCGNSKFSQNPCKLLKDKLPENPENHYNHNFRGSYCTCQRPYPDPEDTVEDEMIQCCVCEDWYHGRHQGGKTPPDSEFAEMICSQCLTKHDFLAHYLGLTVSVVKSEDSKASVDVETGAEKSTKKDTSETVKSEENEPKSGKKVAKEEEKADDNANVKKCESAECKLKTLAKQELPDGAGFFTMNWRKQLCTCEECKAKYKSEGVIFLLDEEDTVSFYEESGKTHQRSHSAPVQRELEALSSLDRVVRTEMVHEYNTLSSSLREYLRKFAENKKVVRDEDIREFFSQLTANKKQRPGSSVQLFCK